MYDEEMDEEMEDFVGGYFEVSEVDFDYEFDAFRFFDFTRLESSLEIEHTKLGFESAPSYPPSRKHSQIMVLIILCLFKCSSLAPSRTLIPPSLSHHPDTNQNKQIKTHK